MFMTTTESEPTTESERTFSQLDIAPTVARLLGIQLPLNDGRAIDLVEGWGCRNAAIIIVDSLGYDLLMHLLPCLKNTSRLIDDGILLRAKAVSNHTTPAIASILSGLVPEHHKIFDKAGAKASSILSLPEIASAAGLRSAVIMETNGAEVYEGLIEIIHGISDRIPPEEFDREACSMTLQSLREGPGFSSLILLESTKACTWVGNGAAFVALFCISIAALAISQKRQMKRHC
jgi:hypothetical protein